MPVHNAEIAVAFDHLADLLEIEGANPFPVRAYRRAAPAGLVALTNVPGIAAKRARALWLDIDDHVCCLSKEMGVTVSVEAHAHLIDGLHSMTRRGWLERRDILNTQPLQELVQLFARR
jgi:DNA polymerase/3'-5' exonuclease PolX